MFQCFRGTCHLHLQGWRISHARNQCESRCQAEPPAFMLVWPWRWRQHVPPKHLSTFNTLHSIISQSTKLFITPALRASNPTFYVLQQVVIQNIKTLDSNVNKTSHFSDGAMSQYKNTKTVSNLVNHKNNSQTAGEWHSFAISHGKGPCDTGGFRTK
jgi:hypothetical protein